MSLENSSDFLLNLSVRDVNEEDKHFYRFKSFRLDVAERRLLHNGVPVPLTPKVFDVLALLVERRGHLVEKNELLNTVWTNTFVEEANITRIIHELRKVLGEGKNGDKYIETVAKKGYRFVAEVEEASEPIVLSVAQVRTACGSGRVSDEPQPTQSANDDLPATAGNSDLRDDYPPVTAGGSDLAAKPKTRFVLLSTGFLSAVFLILLLSFSFQSGSSGNSKVKSIAVLPVKPINAANRDELYEIGLAESIIHRLSATKSFYVRPLSATRQYTEITQDPVAAGREQKTDYVLASNYQLADGKIRLTAQLFNVVTGQIEETYKSEQDAGSVFGAQDAIAGEIGNFLFARFAAVPNKITAKRGTSDEEAYRLYQHGKNLTMRRRQADSQKAVEYFEQAIRLDPNFALAFVGMAHAYGSSGTLAGGSRIQREVYEKARAAVNKAVELDPNLADVYAVRGNLKFLYEWDFPGAEKDLATAIELEPNNDLAHGVYAMLLNHQGRFEEAFAELEIALDIDPNSLAYQRDRGRYFYFARRYDEAIVHLERVLEIDENFGTAYHLLILAYEKKGDYAGAFEWQMKEQKLRNPERLNAYQKAYETGGWENFRRRMLEFYKLDEQTASNYYRLAREYALLNEKEQAFEYLNKSLEKRQTQMIMLKVEPAFDSLRDDPRFDELLMRVGFK